MEEKGEIQVDQSYQQKETKHEKFHKQDETNQDDKLIHVDDTKQPLEDTKDQQGKTKDEKPHQQDVSNQDDKVIHTDDTKQPLEDAKQEKHESIAVKLTVEGQITEAGKVGESHIDSPKKPKVGLKHNRRTKSTIPQPFSLETEKRISRERRRSMDFSESKPKLSKSDSVNYKVNAAATTTTTGNRSSIPRPKVTTTERVDKRFENVPNTKDKVKVKETKKAQGNVKKPEREEVEINKFKKSSTFKASPLPSFYHRKDSSPKPEIKKIPGTRPKSPLLGQQGKKSNPKMEQKETEAKGKVVTSTRTITSTAKESISKLLRTTRKSLITPKETLKRVKSSA